MRVPERICKQLFALVWRHADRAPDFVICGSERPYLKRWYVVKSRFFRIYLHEFLRSDDDRALHDHPWVSCSILLHGEYLEHLCGGRVEKRSSGDVIFRWPTSRHRIELLGGGPTDCFSPAAPRPAWTLFLTGPKVREWGFWCAQGFVRWQDFVAPDNSGEVGPGCGDGESAE